MRRFAQALLAILFLMQALPTAQATHAVPDTPDAAIPGLPEEELFATGIVPVDRLQRNATRDVNGSLDPARDDLDEAEADLAAMQASQALPGMVTLFTDSLDLAGRRGGYGEYREVGTDDAWGVTNATETDTDPRLLTGTRPGGRYAGNADSLLVLPELDLRTGVGDPLLNVPVEDANPALADARDQAGKAHKDALKGTPLERNPTANPDLPAAPQFVPVGMSSVHRFLVQTLDLANSECLTGPAALGAVPPCVPGPGPTQDVDVQPREGLYVLEFERRMNLARQGTTAGRDGVQMLVFTQAPDASLLADCVPIRDLGHDERSGGSLKGYALAAGQPQDPVCTIVETLDRQPASLRVEGVTAGEIGAGPGPLPTAAFANADAYTGYDDWRQVAIDLTPWAERQVWVAFRFASGNTPGDAYFRNPNFFEGGAGFYGVELDDFQLTAPGMAHSIRVRPIHDPWYRPYLHEERPAVAIGTDLPIAADIMNVGTRPAVANVTVRVLQRDAPHDEVWSRNLGDIALGVGQTYRLALEVPHLQFPNVTKDKAGLTLVVDALRSRGQSGGDEADPSDSIASLDVDVDTVQHLVPGRVERHGSTFAAGDDLSFDLELRNDGNAPLTTVVRADLVNTVSESLVADVMPPAMAHQVVSVPPGGVEATTVHWSFPMPDAGQYRLFVRLDDEAPFVADRDLRPISVQPRNIPFIDGLAIKAPVVDGSIGATEWPPAAFEPIDVRNIYLPSSTTSTTGKLGRLAAVADAQHLFLLAEIAHSYQVAGGLDNVSFLLDTGGDEPYKVRWSQMKLTHPVPGPIVAEARVPLQGQPDGIPVASGGTLRVLVQLHDSLGSLPVAVFRFPAAGIVDGEGFLPPNGNQRDEMASWRPLRLEAPQFGQHRLLSLGVGVDRAPPALLSLDTTDCSDLAGWTQTYIPSVGGVAGYSPHATKWNCAPYGEDGRTRLYEGRSPTAVCDGKPCGQWSIEDSVGTDSATRYDDYLVTPPIEVPDIQQPYLVLRHQYATESLIVDEVAGANLYTPDFYLGGNGNPADLRDSTVYITQKARVYIEELRSDGTWGNRTLLRPDGGYSSQETVGIADPVRTRQMAKGPGFSNSPWVFDGWWWPTAEQPHYRPAGSPIASGATFHGSPWMVDRIPLFGGGHGTTEPPMETVEATGKTIRLLFAFPPATYSGDPVIDRDPPRDFGWRIDGLAVTEGHQFARDLAVLEVAPVAARYDPSKLGLGPGTPLTVNVTVANQGTNAIEAVRLCVRMIDITQAPPSNPAPCSGSFVDRVSALRIAPGAVTTLNLSVTVPSGAQAQGARLTFLAGAYPTTGDDFSPDNVLRNATALEVRASPNLAIEVGTDQRIAGTGQSRALFVRVVNQGNVPLTGFTVRRGVYFEDGTPGGTPLPGSPAEWTADDSQPHGTIPVGESRSLDTIALTPPIEPTVDLRMPAAPKSGAYTFSASVSIPGDIDLLDNSAGMVLRTQDLLASQTFSGSGSADLATAGTPGVWSVVGGTLLAGDPATGDIPVGSDATVELTAQPIDLRSAKDAMLTLKHRFDLEAAGLGFDAGRVEISTNGVDWRPLRPEPSPLQGLPDGYPSMGLTGDSALAALTLDETAVAFTGRSADLPGADAAGWIKSQFDLAQDPELSRRTSFEDFSLAALSTRPAPVAVAGPDGHPEFRAADWVLPEPNAESRLRYWWVDNVTLDPAPHSPPLMWWSGTAGPDAEGDPQELVENRLERTFVAPSPPSDRAGDQVIMTWWQWRAGDADGGTGGNTSVSLHEGATDLSTGRAILLLDEDAATGWKQFGIPITGLGGKTLTLRFDYDSAAGPDFTLPTESNNRGWFIDDLQVLSFNYDARRDLRHSPLALTALDTLPAGSATAPGWSTQVVAGSPPRAPIAWTLVGRGAAARDGGWQVVPTEIPGLGTVPGWRFADASRQGYPHLADSRLVTPLVDLGQARGALHLQFDQKYWFEAREKCPLDVDAGNNPQERLDLGCFRSAIDGGAIEYQVFDPATRTFGPWKPLAKGFDDFPERILFDARTDDCTAAGAHVAPAKVGDEDPANREPCTHHRRWTDRLSDVPGNRGRESFGGYPAIEERGMSEEALHVTGQVLNSANGPKWGGSLMWPMGHGTSFPSPSPGLTKTQIEIGPHDCANSGTFCSAYEYLRPWREAPASYVFSGPSPGPGGWSNEAWDVSPLAGEQVRFAFHAASNPSLQFDQSLPEDPEDRGWSLANLRVVGDTLDGKPVRLRLHLATDSSLGAGEWRVDDATLNGERFRDNAAVLSDGPTTLVADQGETVTFQGRFSILGGSPLEGIVAVLDAVRESDLDPYTGSGKVTLTVPPALATAVDADPFGPSTVAAYRLDPLDLDLQPSIPFTLAVRLPESGNDGVLLRWSLLQDRGAEGFVPFPLDVPGNAQTQWVARALRDERVEFEPPTAGQSRLLVTDPSMPFPSKTEPVTVSTMVRNLGTTEPILKASFKVTLVHHKGDDGRQPEVGDERADAVVSSKVSLPTITPGGTLHLDRTFIAEKAGLYRVELSIETAAGKRLDTASSEILVGLPSTYDAIDFDAEDAQQRGWSDASPAHGTNGGGSPDELRWRDIGDRFLWGVTETVFASGTTYCAEFADCHGAARTGPQEQSGPDPGEPPAQVGFDARAKGPAIKLDRVPDGQAFITLRQSHNFEEDDGARVEFLPLAHGTQDPAFPSSSTWCPGGVTYTLPAALADLDGVARSTKDRYIPGASPMGQAGGDSGAKNPEHTPDLLNALTQLREPAPDLRPQRVIGGAPAARETIRFDLSLAATPACPTEGSQAPATLNLVNYTLVPYLHAGTRPGYTTQDHGNEVRQGAQGWAIHSLQVSSRDLAASPAAPTFPLQAGAGKTFFVIVTNNGQAADRVTFSIDPARSTVPDLPGEAWIHLPPELDLDPGETRRVPLQVSAPSNAQPGTYIATIQVASVHDPLTFDEIIARVPVRTVLLPDLALSLQPDLPPGTPFEAGTVVPVHATVFNTGAAPSRQTQLVLAAIDATGATRPIQTVPIPPLCPAAAIDCIGPSKATHTVEWSVPRDIGAYRLQGRVDPASAIDEASETNNLVDLDAAVTPLRQPDLAIVSMSLNGTEGGFAEEGSLVVITVEAKNVGQGVAENVRLKIRFGSATIKEARLPNLAPGQTFEVSVAKVVSRGDYLVAASIVHDAPDANVDDDDLRRPLRVRGHDLSLRATPENVTIAPGGTVAFTVNATNNGNGVERVTIGLAPGTVGWGLRVLPSPLTIAPGQTGSASVELSAAESTDAGPTVLHLIGVPSGQMAAKVALALPVTVAVRPGAPGLQAATNQSVAPGNATLNVTVSSTSNALQSVLVQVDEAGWYAVPTELRLEPGANRTLDLAVVVPSGAAVGAHAVNVTVRDAQGVLLRSLPVLVFVEPAAKLTGTWSGAARQDSPELGVRRATYTLRVDNAGNVPLRPRIDLIGLGAGIAAGQAATSPVLAPGEQWLAPVVLNLAPDVEDAFGVAELWGAEGASERFAVLPLPSLDAAPDLHIAAVQLTPRGGIAAGQATRVHATVENVGGVEAPASVVFVAVNGLLVSPVSIAALPAGSSVDVSANVTFTKAGEYLVSVVADGMDAVPELQDSDNARTVPVDVEEAALPDRLRDAPAANPWLLAVALLAIAVVVRRTGAGRP